MSEAKYRWTVEGRHGDGPWVLCNSHEMSEAEAESQILLLQGLRKAGLEGRLTLEQINRFSSELLGLDFDAYRAKPLSERIAIILALHASAASVTVQ